MKVNSSEFIPRVKAYLFDLQNRLCRLLEEEDGTGRFQEDVWQHSEGGGAARLV